MQTSSLPGVQARAWADYPGVVRELLTRRGITDETAAQRFFSPSFDQISDPGLLAGMAEAVARLQKALSSKEQICILGDYDADGICGTVLLASALSEVGGTVMTYTPDRFSEGYGISLVAVDACHKAGVKLLVAVDCGSKNHAELEHAAKLGIDVIVCDHHTLDDKLPKAVAILNPKRSDSRYPNRDLCGTGVAFTLWYGLAKALHLPEEQIVSYLDLVALGTCADAVSVLGENRVLVSLGLQRIRQEELRPGLDALLGNANLHPKQTPFPLDAHRIVYSLAPRLNAAGRMAHGDLSVRLLLAPTFAEAEPLAQELEELNNRRRDLDQALTAEALDMIKESPGGDQAPATVLFNPDWSLGVVGITASRLLEHYPRPTVVLTEYEGKLTGSARSGPGFDVYQALASCSDILERFGGHSYAAGLTLSKDNFGAFFVRFSQLAYEGKQLAKDAPAPARTQAEAELGFKAITQDLCEWMDAMAPYGPGNPRPLFKADHLMLLEESRVLQHKITRQPNHLMLLLADKEGYVMEAAGWGMAKLWDRVQAQSELSMTFHLELFRTREGQMMPRLVIRHLEV